MNEINEIIRKEHNDDESQLSAIFSNSNRIMLVAPAGCGKTKTLISKISYLISQNIPKHNKKILALTFSVNAAFKMRKDIMELCPKMIGEIVYTNLQRKITISNYHGLSRQILSKYGYLLDENLRKVNDIIPVSEDQVKDNKKCNLTGIEIKELETFGVEVSNGNREYVDRHINSYYNLMIKLLKSNIITYNAFLVLLIVLFDKKPDLLQFYRKLYPILMIDEFQDTNYLSWLIVKKLVTTDTRMFFMGDKLQRIYGFIGALPNLIDEAIREFNMTEVKLLRNYRFKENENMLLLDDNIRKNAEGLNNEISKSADIELKIVDKVDEEIDYIINRIKEVEKEKTSLAILVRGKSGNISSLIEKMNKMKINYFYALFTENDCDYIQFHMDCLQILMEHYRPGTKIGRKFLNNLYDDILKKNQSPTQVQKSLLILTKLFFDKLLFDYSYLNNDEKISLINDTFGTRSLKQNMDKVEANVIISTIHSAKGLEWDYVLFPSCINFVFPTYRSLCGICEKISNGNYCKLALKNEYQAKYLEELSIFYVGITRARLGISFSAPNERINSNGQINKSKISCLLSLKGINIVLK